MSLSLVGVILDPPELRLPVAGGQWDTSVEEQQVWYETEEVSI